MKHVLLGAAEGFAFYQRGPREYVVVGVTFRPGCDRPLVLPAVPREGSPLGQVGLRISDSTLHYCAPRVMGRRAAWGLFERLVTEAEQFSRAFEEIVA